MSTSPSIIDCLPDRRAPKSPLLPSNAAETILMRKILVLLSFFFLGTPATVAHAKTLTTVIGNWLELRQGQGVSVTVKSADR